MITMIGGRAGEGKSTFARFCTKSLIDDHKEGSALVPFARMVKETAMFMGWNEEKDAKGRKLLQNIGNIGREYDMNLWADHAVAYIQELAGTFSYIFIDDWRFPNEENVVKDCYSPVITVRLRRADKFHTLHGTALYNDISEISLPDHDEYYDHVINNDGTLEQLEEQAKKFVKNTLLRGK